MCGRCVAHPFPGLRVGGGRRTGSKCDPSHFLVSFQSGNPVGELSLARAHMYMNRLKCQACPFLVNIFHVGDEMQGVRPLSGYWTCPAFATELSRPWSVNTARSCAGGPPSFSPNLPTLTRHVFLVNKRARSNPAKRQGPKGGGFVMD